MNHNYSNVCIIGAGWYGCHIAYSLTRRGYNVKIYEKNDAIFSEASGVNQNRLHLGFHYPRCFATRAQSRRGFRLFKNYYPELTTPLGMAIYAVPESGSIIDFCTYRDIMTSTGLYFEDVTNSLPFHLTGIEGAVDCEEALINTSQAKEFFRKRLSDLLHLSSCVNWNDCLDMADSGALVLDCTWNKIVENKIYYYEVSLMFIYEVEHEFFVGLTLMDGKLFSIYPFTRFTATLSDVEYTPVGLFESHKEAYAFLKENLSNPFRKQLEQMEIKVCSFFPHFHNYYKNPRPILSIKTKKTGNLADSRSTYMTRHTDSFYSVHAGKIDTIFDIEHQVLGLL